MATTQRASETTSKRKQGEQVDHENKKAKQASAAQDQVPMVVQQLNTNANGEAFLLFIINKRVETVFTRECRIFFATREDLVTDVFKGLIAHNFLSCPVLQKTKGKWFAFIDMADIVRFIVQNFGEADLKSTNDVLELMSNTEFFRTQKVNKMIKYPQAIRSPYHPVPTGYSLFSAFECMAREKGLHRIPIVDENRKLVSVLTQSQLVHFAWQNIDMLGGKRLMTVKDMAYHLQNEVITVKMEDTAMHAFTVMVDKHVSGVAVVGEGGKLVDQLSLRDLKASAPDGRFFWHLYRPVSEYLEHCKTKGQAFERPAAVVYCTHDHTLEQVMQMIVQNRIHRVFVVDSEINKKPVSVITLRDILYAIITPRH